MAVNFDDAVWCHVDVRGQKFLFTDVRIVPDTIPGNIFVYEVRSTDDGSEPCEISEKIFANFYGTIIGNEPIKEWDQEKDFRHFLFLKFSDIPEWYEGENGISSNPTDEFGNPLEPHYVPEDWDCDYEEIESLELANFLAAAGTNEKKPFSFKHCRPSLTAIKAAEKVLADNGIDPDEVDTVLQAIGYTLLNQELYPESSAYPDELTENQKFWFTELLKDAVDDARGAASNERLFAKGSKSKEEATQHYANAVENANYADFLESLMP